MSGTESPSRAELYAARAKEHEARAEYHARRAEWLSHARVLAFLVAVVAGLLGFWGGSPLLAGVIASLAGLGFLLLVALQGRVLRAEDSARRHARVNRDGLARTTGGWRELSELGTEYLAFDHPFAADLNLFGRGSLFQRINVAHTRLGQSKLAELLAGPAGASEIALRQASAKHLSGELDFRQNLEALSLEAVTSSGRLPLDSEPVLAWAEADPELSRHRWLVWLARLLPFCTAAGLVANSGFGLSAILWGLPLLGQLGVLWAAREVTSRVFHLLTLFYPVLARYSELLRLMESHSFSDALGQSWAVRLRSKGQPASLTLASLGRRLAWYELRHNGLVYPFLDVLFCWDVHATLALEHWQKASGSKARAWLEVIGELEAMSSVAGLVHDEPTFTFPEIVTDRALFVAEGLGHPLLQAERRVTNDVRLREPGTALLVTGSNMGGKSTLLRSMGLGSVLANAGASVCARRLAISPLAVRTCLNVFDSLEGNQSHFYAEVRRLKGTLDATHGSLPVFFLLDEILHGTNARERGIGARWLIAELLRRGALGAVTTHDLDLTDLPQGLSGQVELVHFQEDVLDGKMTFDYRLRPGPVTAGNALRLMRLLGLDVPV
jgi:hypothetical protein